MKSPRDKDELASNPSDVEIIKDRSAYLRGTLEKSLADPVTGAIAPDDTQVSKFHGIYQQDDRDIRLDRERRRLEPAWSFMIRVRIPGGILSAEQWLMLDRIANSYGVNHFKLTTRQAVQFHGIIKGRLRDVMQSLDRSQLDSIATCGDVNRNVMCSPVPYCGSVWEKINPYAAQLSQELLPQSKAWHEVWLNGKKLDSDAPAPVNEEEPLYGKHYLPRKFKTNIAVPPYNDTDVFANDLGFIAIADGDDLLGFNVSVGGGLGMTHSVTSTHPSLASVIGFCLPDSAIEVAKTVMSIQRDFGNRHERRLARLKYTIESMGLDIFTAELNRRLSQPLAAAKPYSFEHNNDVLGWFTDWRGLGYRTLYVESGRVRDTEQCAVKAALLQLSALDICDFRLTGNQNLVLGAVKDENRARIDELLAHHGVIDFEEKQPAIAKTSIACVAMPTCPLAMAEAERYLPSLLSKIQGLLDEHSIHTPVNIRMTGCPNGCGRPYLAEIGLVGKAEKSYNLHLGGSQQGDRLNVLYRENLHEDEILSTLSGLFADYATNRKLDEFLGDWMVRTGVVAPTGQAQDFHHIGV
ncbi:MAG: NADPH-dependent assimilatory sulfite reductase hemoprotein subunit [Gammaproteobacteria bacterium]|nr:NADPH-dependent assimilatory sulfite reductase hemoprotein subunit [Gammaproteobacteria bacterium]